MPELGRKRTPMWEWLLLAFLIIVIVVFVVLWVAGSL
jgi:hypothetical protein